MELEDVTVAVLNRLRDEQAIEPISGSAIARAARARDMQLERAIQSEVVRALEKQVMMAPAFYPAPSMELWPWSRGDRRISIREEWNPVPSNIGIPSPVEPTTALLDAPDTSQREFLTGYQRLAAKIGYHCVEAERVLAEGDLIEWLHEQAMPVYDYEAVKQYLDATVAEMNAGPADGVHHRWGWMPLRQCDTKTNMGGGRQEVYIKPIPYPVLCTIEKLVDQFGERVNLLVSDIYTVPKADPFLAVSVPGSQRLFVIERWDEPKFRG